MSLPLAVLGAEAVLARRRVARKHRTEALLIHAAVVDVLSTGAGHLNSVLDQIE